jgi:hypothetical protein
VGLTSAFGPRFEKGRKVDAARPRVVLNEKPTKKFEPSLAEIDQEASFDTMETTFHLETLLDDIASSSENSFFAFDSLRDRAEDLASETFAGDVICTGEECDLECDIPKEWSEIKGEVELNNVMEFLGIRRAQPLRRAVDWQ